MVDAGVEVNEFARLHVRDDHGPRIVFETLRIDLEFQILDRNIHAAAHLGFKAQRPGVKHEQAGCGASVTVTVSVAWAKP